MQNKPIHEGSTQDAVDCARLETPTANSNLQLGRRTFMKRLGMGGTVLLPATAWLASRTAARAGGFSGRNYRMGPVATIPGTRAGQRGVSTGAGISRWRHADLCAPKQSRRVHASEFSQCLPGFQRPQTSESGALPQSAEQPGYGSEQDRQAVD